ncbi:hypothetical protein D3C73_1313590 [compost metagenome]
MGALFVAVADGGDHFAGAGVDGRDRPGAGVGTVQNLGAGVQVQAVERVGRDIDRGFRRQGLALQTDDLGLVGAARADGGDIEVVVGRVEDDLIQAAGGDLDGLLDRLGRGGRSDRQGGEGGDGHQAVAQGGHGGSPW